MSDARPEILTRIEAAFEPYLKPVEEIHEIRVRLTKYLESFAPRKDATLTDLETFTIPNNITGIRRRYLKAQCNNLKAKLEYAQLRERIDPDNPSLSDKHDSSRILRTHCELLELRNQYQKFQVLSHYLAEAGTLAEQHHLFDTQLNHGFSAAETDVTNSIDNTAELARARELTRNLEVAVVQANHQLKQERQRLEQAQSRAPDPETASPEAELHALLATKDELTSWIEASLAQCDASADENFRATDQTPQYNPTNDIQAIEEQYEKYLQARTRLLDSTAALTTPLPPSTQSQPTNTHESLHPISQNQKPKSPLPQTPTPTPILPYIDTHHLPHLIQDTSLTHAQSHLENLISAHTQTQHGHLLRLSDESHLLPSYPILKPSAEDLDLDETGKLLRSWRFAMEAAGTATAAAVQGQVRNGERAVDEADAALQGMEDMKEIWKKLERV